MDGKLTVYNGQRYREVARRANLGELVKVVHANHNYDYGEVFLPDEIEYGKGASAAGVYCYVLKGRRGGNFSGWIDINDYVVLEPIDEDTTSRMDALEARMSALEARLGECVTTAHVSGVRVNVGGCDLGKVDSISASFQRHKPLTREQVIEMAKADVEKLVNTPITDCVIPAPWYDNCKESYRPDLYDSVRFVVNRDKRTVVALIYYKDNGDMTGKVWARGKARACDGDCFNVHIGRAISLRRAFGMPVPREYIDAPQPTVAKVGDVVRFDDCEDTFTVVERLDGDSPLWSTNVRGPLVGFVVIDDSGEDVM